MVDRKLMRQIAAIIDSGNTSPFFRNFSGGPFVQAFEKEFARYVDAKYAVSMSNGTLALHAAYSALGLRTLSVTDTSPEIICPPWTFVATVSEIVRAGYRPVFADVTKSNGSLDALKAAFAVTPRTRAIVLMHPLGSMCNLNEFNYISTSTHEPVIIEDSCQALKKNLGVHGAISCFSFQQTKSLSTLGEGGMCATNDKSLYDALCYFRNHGEKYGFLRRKYRTIGTNYRMTEVAACVGLHALKQYDVVVKRQLALGKILKESMESTDWLIPQDPWTENGYIFAGRIAQDCTAPEDWSCIKTRHHATAKKTREQFLKRVKRWNQGIPGRVIGGGYSELIYELPAFRQYTRTCPVAEMWRDHAVWMDVRKMSVEDVKSLGREIERFKP